MLDPKFRILIVDDMVMMRKALTKFCREIGLTNITEASSGREAWEEVRSANPPFDLIISDWNMPEGSGLDLLKQVRSEQRLSTTPIIMITSEKEKEQIEQAIKAGASDYLPKPFTSDSLREKIQHLLDRIKPKSQIPKTKIRRAK